MDDSTSILISMMSPDTTRGQSFITIGCSGSNPMWAFLVKVDKPSLRSHDGKIRVGNDPAIDVHFERVAYSRPTDTTYGVNDPAVVIAILKAALTGGTFKVEVDGVISRFDLPAEPPELDRMRKECLVDLAALAEAELLLAK